MKRRELFIYIAAVVILNLTLLWEQVNEPMIFLSHKVMDGQVWRLFTHPFVHVSWYHLLLDGVAFVVLYLQLTEPERLKRTAYVFVCGITSLVAAVSALPATGAFGYCGLSGIAHGLMAVSALELIFTASEDRSKRRAGFWSLGLLTAKCLYEVHTGKMFFGFIHMGMLGTPVAASHAGGVLGGAALFLILRGVATVRSLSPCTVFSLS